MNKYKLDLDKIKADLFQHSVSKRDLATVLDISDTQTYRKLDGKTEFKPSEICSIAALFNKVPGDYFSQPPTDTNCHQE